MPTKRKKEAGIPVFTVINFQEHSVTEFISQAEAARQLAVSRATVNFLVSKGKLRSAIFAGRRVVVVEDVLSYKPIRPGPKPGPEKATAKGKATTKKRGSKKK